MPKEITITDLLIPALQTAFPNTNMRTGAPPDPIAIFPAACAELGDVQICDDGDEVTIIFENLTHHHVNPYNAKMSPAQRTEWVTQETVNILRGLFDDRIFIWSSKRGHGESGWIQDFDGTIPDNLPNDAKMFVWSKQLK